MGLKHKGQRFRIRYLALYVFKKRLIANLSNYKLKFNVFLY